MNNLWQLKKISNGSALNEPQLLPENWGPIFGLHGITDRLGDLSWLGDDYKDMGWFVVGEAPPTTPKPIPSTKAEIVWHQAKALLADSDWTMLPDVILTSEQKAQWMEYRRALREIRLQPEFPENILWPKLPD